MTPEQLLREIEAFDVASIPSLPESLRARISAAASKLSLGLETPTDTVSRVLITQPVEEISVRIGADLGIFSTLAKKESTTIQELAQITGAEPVLLSRVLRSLAAFHAVKEVSPGTFTTVPSYSLFDVQFEQAFGGCQDILDKCRRELPRFLKSTNYASPTDPTNTAVQYAYHTQGQGYIESLMSDPNSRNSLQSFVVLMSVWAEGFSQLQDIYPVQERLLQGGVDPQGVTFVDVGGGLGQKAIALKKSHPELPGRFVVQDLEPVIANAKADDSIYEDVSLTVHDFMTEQPIKGAKFYYIRQCLHNWPDDKCITILKKLGEAAKREYSYVLIHEIIVPEIGSGPWIASQDFNMMSMFAVGERTEADWRGLCSKAGLKVTGVFLNDHPSREGIIEAVSH